MTASISEGLFGKLDNGQDVKLFVLRNALGAEAEFTDLGASWIGFRMSPDQPSLVLGCDTLDAFVQQQATLGNTVGRFANRIADGKFSLDGIEYQLDKNLPPHHLHGGNANLAHKVWDSHIVLHDGLPTLTFSCFSADGEEGYPGNVQFKVIITLSDDNQVTFDYSAVTDKKTIINLTNHSYFNLNGSTNGSLENHEFVINSDTYLIPDENTLPTGELASVENTIFDFRSPQSAFLNISSLNDNVLKITEGYDHCYCYPQDGQFRELASVHNSQNNIQLICSSTLPGMQFYTGNFLGGTPFNSTDCYQSHGAFCFEPGFWPDSPNKKHFSNCEFDEKKSYTATIQYWFKQIG